MPHHSGFVSILGRPNAGKSTLLNALVGEKLAIVSDKPQTTRTSVQGVLTLPDAQIVFIDTPGIHDAAESLLNRRMMDEVHAALEDRDVLLFLDDCTRTFAPDDQVLDILARVDTPTILVLTKIDRLEDKRLILPRIENWKTRREFADYVPISALRREGLDALTAAIVSRLPEDPPLFPPDHITDQPERFLAAEYIREKILRETRQEVPHSVAVLVDVWEDTSSLLRIGATIYVEREGQKAIMIGRKGDMLKRIGTAARKELEPLLSRKIFLELYVKVRPSWREDPNFLKEIGWR